MDVELRSYDWGTFFGDIKAGRFQLFSLTWVGIRSPDIFRYAFHSASVPPSGANRGRFASPLVDRLIGEAQGAIDIEAQAKLYRRLQHYLCETLPYVPLWYEDQVFVARREVQGYRLSVDGNYDALATVRRSQAAGVVASR
jgi:peptide/nickel transport system substrate-binding protein